MEIVRRVLDDYARGENESALDALHPEVVFDQTFRPEGGLFRGREAVAEGLRTWTGAFEEWRQEIEEIIDAGDRVLVVAHEFGRGKGSGAAIEQTTFQVYEIDGGKIVHFEGFLDREDALEAAGLSE